MAVQIPFPLPATGYALNSKIRVNLDFLVDKFNEFNSGTATWDRVAIGTANSLTGQLTFYNANNANYVTFQPGATSSSHTYTLPLALPSSTGVLQSASDGTLSWATTITSQLLFPSGTLGTPSIRAESNPDTGLNYRSTNNELALVYDGAKFLSYDNVGGLEITVADSSVAGKVLFAPGGYTKYMTHSLGTSVILTASSASSASYKSLLGTTNQITVAFNANDVTLSLPQAIATTSDVTFGSLTLGNGSDTSPSLRLRDGNTGIMSPATDQIGLVCDGARMATIANGLFFIQTDLQISGNAELTGAGATFEFNGATSGSVLLKAAATTTPYTFAFPADAGTADYVLKTDGSGNTSWVAQSSGANVALSNLAGVAINTSLVSDTNNTDDLGTSSIAWKDLYLAGSIKSGSNTAITVDTSGRVTKPNQPCFLVVGSGGSNDNVTGDGTTFTVEYGTEIFDVGSNFASNVFTAPVTGKYLFSFSVFLTDILSTHTERILTLVTSNRSYSLSLEYSLAEPVRGMSNTILADMDANDTAYVTITVSGSTKVVDSNKSSANMRFSGSLVN